ncbi:SpoIIE family protein phosphatase [Streptomyces sp. NPDC046805]|uniref:PP2C family protein-serine/threonine phosphatase n=1 Tax=Streptomyces sp. NPDC046805 TaxID=3155134 RepID=UPI0033C091FF
MPSHLSADRPSAQPPGRGSVEALISQTRRLRGDVDAVRRDSRSEGSGPRERWQRALYDLALHQLNDLAAHLAQLRDGPPSVPSAPQEPAPQSTDSTLLSRVGSAEWNLLTDAASWSEELYQILGRSPATPALTLDELPSLVDEEDRPTLTAMVTECLVDAKPIDGEFRILWPDGSVRTVHMMGEPVLDADGSTASMWAVLRDVSDLRRSQRTVRETHDSLQRHRQRTRTGHRFAAQPAGPEHQGHQGARSLDLAARHLTAVTTAPIGGGWYDALELPDGDMLLSVGSLTGHDTAVTSGTTMLLGALRGMAMAGTGPGQLLAWLNQLLDTLAQPPLETGVEATVQPVLGSALCCRYRPATHTLVWAHVGHPAPLLFRDGTGHLLDAPDGVLLGTASGAAYGQAEVTLEPGDLLMLHTEGLAPGHDGADGVHRLLGLAPRFDATRPAQDCMRTVVEELSGIAREDDACVLVAKVSR